jgi:FkbM family methyltransferase
MSDSCYHVFLDIGSNLGVHARFLFEPEKYPDAVIARQIFDQHFGVDRDNRDICVFAFEPNPAHRARHERLGKSYGPLGWRYYFLGAGVSDQGGEMTFYHLGVDADHEEWGFGMTGGGDSVPEVVPVVRLADWLLENIKNRQITDEPFVKSKPPTVVMKMDVEGMEYLLLPDLIVSGALCQTVDYAFGEMHQWMNIKYSHARGGLTLNETQQKQDFSDHLFQIFHAARHCRTTRFDLLDDEAYLHDGIPLPGEE